ncbi:class I SAM-dependent RNA methyltransferase [Acetobacter sp. TBRC 12305]|uniref:Class I SAM-dependent RNA methyltransferase n=1 Tax=Acetobacter garciniae TaxID=2817435 RepID=A0A939HPT3_9PROT|nr:class I SAM-dependent RNA methyltransferase [Acetobacter garciniae]MBO1325788.1 class I SAM-dependent RNA methyltransferase [Acetobacter garciniae]MBX0345688.1 class I SAM-dependent RNA methyltransferase [Acetobacter garciniae]
MEQDRDFEIFLATVPGLEPVLYDEIRLKGFKSPAVTPGGVTIRGGWPEVWRANLWVRGASKVLARLKTFRVVHLAQLDRLARQMAWGEILRADVPFRVEAVCAGSRIYHAGAAAERITTAISETLGATAAPDAQVVVMARIERNSCTISIDTSGDLLHRRGYKQAVNRAPMRETMAALFLRQCGYDGSEPVLDPMCGSGTFVIEAAEIAARLNPGRSRHFAFELFANFDAAAWQRMRDVKSQRIPSARFYGSDRDAGAVSMSEANAQRAGVGDYTEFHCRTISELTPPAGPAGLVIVNPPYGTRIGERDALFPLYRALGQVLLKRFTGWRAGLVTADTALAHATELPFLPNTAPVPHGGLRVSLFQTGPLPQPPA